MGKRGLTLHTEYASYCLIFATRMSTLVNAHSLKGKQTHSGHQKNSAGSLWGRGATEPGEGPWPPRGADAPRPELREGWEGACAFLHGSLPTTTMGLQQGFWETDSKGCSPCLSLPVSCPWWGSEAGTLPHPSPKPIKFGEQRALGTFSQAKVHI